MVTTQTIIFDPDENLPFFKYDRGLIEQVLYNLLDNALYYTPPNSTIKIIASRQTDKCVICISDNGYGIPESELKSVFDKFLPLAANQNWWSGHSDYLL